MPLCFSVALLLPLHFKQPVAEQFTLVVEIGAVLVLVLGLEAE